MSQTVVRWPHRNIEIRAPVPIQRSDAWEQAPNMRLEHPYGQTGLHLGTTAVMVCHIQLPFPRLFPGFFFKLVLRSRISLGMSGIRRHLAPTVSSQQSVYRRLWNFVPNPFLKCNVDWTHHQHAACSCRSSWSEVASVTSYKAIFNSSSSYREILAMSALLDWDHGKY